MAIDERIRLIWQSKGAAAVKRQAQDVGKALGGIAPTLAAGALAGAAGAVIKESIDLAREQIKAEAQLAAALKSTGREAEFSQDQLKSYAGQLQAVTNFGDEATIKTQAMLLTFKQIGGDAFPRATRAIQDLSVAMDQGLKESTVQIGKALNDPVEGLTALRRVGIQFTDDQENLIKSFVEANDVAAAQNVILTELESQFGGSAAAAKDGFIGVQNAIGDTKEEIGKFFLTINENAGTLGTFEAGLFTLNEKLATMNTLFATGIPAARDYISALTGLNLEGVDIDSTLRDVAEGLRSSGSFLGTALGFAVDFGRETGKTKQEINEMESGQKGIGQTIDQQNEALKDQRDIVADISRLLPTVESQFGFGINTSPNIPDTTGLEITSIDDDSAAAAKNRLELSREIQRAEEEAAETSSRAWGNARSEQERQVNRIKGLIEGELQPTLSEVWSGASGGDDGRNIDEWARRAATLATEGLNSEWIGQLQSQFAGQSFWEPVAQAIEAGDDSALRAAATDLLTGPGVSQLWDKELIKERVRNSLIEQNLRQELIDTIYAELAGEGISVDSGENAGLAGLPIATSLTGSIATALPGAAAESSIGQTLIQSMIKDVKENKDGLNTLVKVILDGLETGFSDMMGATARQFIESLAEEVAKILGMAGAGAARL